MVNVRKSIRAGKAKRVRSPPTKLSGRTWQAAQRGGSGDMEELLAFASDRQLLKQPDRRARTATFPIPLNCHQRRDRAGAIVETWCQRHEQRAGRVGWATIR